MYYDLVLKQLQEYNDKIFAISRNLELSDIGRQKAKALVQNDSVAYRPRAIDLLKGDFERMRERFKENNAARVAEKNRIESSFDFQALNYHSDLVKKTIARVSQNPDLLVGLSAAQQFRAEWNAAKTYGDKSKMRAWVEVGSEELDMVFPHNMDIHDLIRDMRAELPALTGSPKLTEIDATGKQLADEALVLVDAIQTAAKYYYPIGLTQENKVDPLDELLDFVDITREPVRYGGVKINVELRDTPKPRDLPFSIDELTLPTAGQ